MQEMIENLETHVVASIGTVSPRLANRVSLLRSSRSDETGASTIEIVMYTAAFAIIVPAIAYILWVIFRDGAKAVPTSQDPGLGK